MLIGDFFITTTLFIRNTKLSTHCLVVASYSLRYKVFIEIQGICYFLTASP